MFVVFLANADTRKNPLIYPKSGDKVRYLVREYNADSSDEYPAHAEFVSPSLLSVKSIFSERIHNKIPQPLEVSQIYREEKFEVSDEYHLKVFNLIHNCEKQGGTSEIFEYDDRTKYIEVCKVSLQNLYSALGTLKNEDTQINSNITGYYKFGDVPHGVVESSRTENGITVLKSMTDYSYID